jgi:ribulose-5-phosphate 4-epimerase/fuculose-1-phosphate aldolase
MGEALIEFQAAGRVLFSLGLVRGSEGNLSVWDGERLTITRTGSQLASLGGEDVLEGTLDAPPGDASSDLTLQLQRYRDGGPGAIVHAHPSGTVPEGWEQGQPHGVYVFAATLEKAVEIVVSEARAEEKQLQEEPAEEEEG